MNRVQKRERHKRNDNKFKRGGNVRHRRGEQRSERDFGKADSEYYHAERQRHSGEVIRARLYGSEHRRRYVCLEEKQRKRGDERDRRRVKERAANAYVAFVARNRVYAQSPTDNVETYVYYRDVNQHFGVVREKGFYDRNPHEPDVAHKRAYRACSLRFVCLFVAANRFERESCDQIRRKVNDERTEKDYRHIRKQRRVVVLFHKSGHGKDGLRNVDKHRHERGNRRVGQHFTFTQNKPRNAQRRHESHVYK